MHFKFFITFIIRSDFIAAINKFTKVELVQTHQQILLCGKCIRLVFDALLKIYSNRILLGYSATEFFFFRNEFLVIENFTIRSINILYSYVYFQNNAGII